MTPLEQDVPEETALAGDLRARLEEVRRRIEASARSAGRRPEDVTLVAVSKTYGAEVVREAISAGASDFGENHVHEAEEKIERVGREAAR